MQDNTSRHSKDNKSEHRSDQDRESGHSLDEATRSNTGGQQGTADLSDASNLDEKSSGMGRRDKGTGLSTKDGLTGSDYDGQVTD